MVGKDLAIDLGTCAIKIFMQDRGIVLDEPAIAAVDRETNEVIAVGKEAYAMLGRTSARVAVTRPMSCGVISDYDLVQDMLHRFLRELVQSKLFMPRVVVSVPCEMTEVQRRSVVDAISGTGVRKICLIEEPIAAAIGAGMDIARPHGTCVVDVGGGTTDMAVISLSGVAIAKTINIAGDTLDEAVMKYMRYRYHLLIGKRMAEEVKIAIGGVGPRSEPLRYRVKGRNLITGLPQSVEISSEELIKCLADPVMKIVQELQRILQVTPPELMGDILSDGVILTGGSAQLYGLDRVLGALTKLPVRVAEEPACCVALGAGKALGFIDDMDKKEYGVLNPLSDAY